MQAVPLVGIGEFRVPLAHVDADPEVDVPFPDLDDVVAGAELAHERLGRAPLDVELGGVFDQRLGPESAGAGRKKKHADDANSLEELRARILLVWSRNADAYAHSGESPAVRGQCLQAPALHRNRQ